VVPGDGGRSALRETVDAVLRRVFPWLGLAALLLVVVATVGWHNEPAASRRAPNPPPPQPSMSLPEASSVVSGSTLVQSDLPEGFRPAVSDDPTSDPSLTLCGVTFDNEGARIAAHRVSFLAPRGRGQLRSVVVAFQRGYASWALSEIEAAAGICTRPVRPSAEQQPDLLALRVRTTARPGVPRHDLVVERRGDVLSLLDVDDRLDRLTLPLARRLSLRLEGRLPDQLGAQGNGHLPSAMLGK
jgi:hypothetical protein